MKLYETDPTRDARWGDYLARNGEASVFHTAEWVEALRRTYGYQPLVFSSAPPDRQLSDGVICCEVESWLTGRRLVSLPFSDHCQPLTDDPGRLGALVQSLPGILRDRGCRYLEMRPRRPGRIAWGTGTGFRETARYWLHRVDLRCDLDELWGRLHAGCVRRKIRRAEREGLSCEVGGRPLLSRFYRLQLMTRRRHGLPPQPLAWFENLIECLGARLRIHLASAGDQPLAGVLILRYKNSAVFKYGCSDSRFNRMGGGQLLLWNAIREARRMGCSEFDLGRSEQSNWGLIQFKDRWGGERLEMPYFRYPEGAPESKILQRLHHRVKPVFRWLPDSLLSGAGKLLYRHFG